MLNESQPQTGDRPPMSHQDRVDRASDEFERQFGAKKQPRLEDFLDRADPAEREQLLGELLRVELELRHTSGEQVQREEYLDRFSGAEAVVESALESFDENRGAGSGFTNAPQESYEPGPVAQEPRYAIPESIGRFQPLSILGQGAFGVVYLARDPQLDRLVALKVPRLERFDLADALRIFADEARKAAQLDHPGIVRILDVQAESDLVYIVMQFIDGPTLTHYMKSHSLPPRRIAELLVAIAQAVGYAHHQGFVHRDLKTDNILLDAEGNPYVADFGLALHESVQRKHVGELAGTRPYMSPEQVRGESHRLDGRSDIWSLGVILYELLTGRRPFRGEKPGDLLEDILHGNPKPPRMIAPSLPAELSRICLVCLASRSTDRYQSTADLIDDLRHWLDSQDSSEKASASVPAPAEAAASQQPVRIVPKGLRSFDAGDADFFLELLPGPHDREGLPKSIRFWKTRIEQRDVGETFTVGLLYGPSGCGKSSLVKAGLLPRLSADILPIYIEATAADTEVRLIKGLKKHCSELPDDAGLPQMIGSLRDRGGSRGRKVLLVLDQFEQWLHAHAADNDSQLVPALRQCDGEEVQCLLMVRDDFSSAAHRLFQDLELEVSDGQNYALVDLFTPEHARKVLAAFGRAHGRLPEFPDEPTDEQSRFLELAVDGLASEGKVICVRLALFAEMMKGRAWNEASLRNVGGTEGVGVAFLEETFNSRSAPPSHRPHQEAVQHVLRALLPEVGTDIKGQMRSYDQLLEASGYQDGRKEFDAFLRILDSEVRLLTPTEPDETDADEASEVAKGRGRYYQLTHDYLVPAIRQWLTRKQKETRKGRAELRLEERAALWKAKQENQQLPSAWEYATIHSITDTSKWTDPQRNMMRRAGRLHITRLATIAAVLLLAVVSGVYVRNNIVAENRQQHADSLVQQILTAEIQNVRDLIATLDNNNLWPLAESQFAAPLLFPDDDPRKLRACLAVVRHDPRQVEFLLERLPALRPAEVAEVRKTLAERAQDDPTIGERLWDRLANLKADDVGVLPTAAALAGIAPPPESSAASDSPADDPWRKHSDLLAEALVRSNVVYLGQWLDQLESVRVPLLPGLAKIYSDQSDDRSETQRELATTILERYATDQAELLASLLMDGEPAHYKRLFPLAATAENSDQVLAVMRQELAKTLRPDWNDPPVDPAWTKPDAGALAAIEAAGGLVNVEERLAFCLSMPRERFIQVAEQLRPAGFRPTRVRPHAVGDQLHVSAVWTRDGRTWQIQWDLEQEDLPQPAVPALHEGLAAADVAGYLDNSGERPVERYVALWSEAAEAGGERRVVAGVSEQQIAAAKQALGQAGLKSLDTLHVFLAADGSRKYSAVLSGSGADSTIMAAYAGWERVDQPQWDVSIAAEGKLPDPLALYRQQLVQVEQALKAQPEVPQLKLLRAQLRFRLDSHEAALADLDDLVAKGAATAEVQQYRAFVLARLGKSEAAGEALDAFQKATESESQRMYVGVIVAAWLGEKDKANQALDEAAARTPADAGLLYDAACASSLASLPGASLDAESAQAFAERALQLLGLAVEAGYSDGKHLQSDPDLTPLHQDARFAELVARISPSSRFATLWRPDTQVESRLLSDLSTEDHLAQCRTLIGEGFRPISLGLLAGDSGGSSVTASVWHRPLIPDADKEQLAIRQSHAAVNLLRLGQADLIWPLLRHQPDPRLRSYILSRLASLEADGSTLLLRLDTEPDVSARRTLILALGDQARLDLLADGDREPLIATLLAIYREDPDPGLHGAAEWTLKQLGQADELAKIQAALATGEVVGNRQWYLTRTGGHTLVVLEPQDAFLMGSPVAEAERLGGPTGQNEIRHRRRIARRYSVGTHEVTVAQFRTFLEDHQFVRQYAREEDAPANVVNWYDAARFCNWLSEREGIPRDQWCYDPDQRFEDGMSLYPDYLSRTGYRLPTEAEWEYACRAGAVTSRHFGETPLLLGEYAWSSETSQDRWMLPVGSLRPNDFGLFDMQGNALEWCQEVATLYPTDRPEVLDEEHAKVAGSTRFQGVRDADRRVLRGGSFIDFASYVRSAHRSADNPGNRSYSNGFRASRTLPP